MKEQSINHLINEYNIRDEMAAKWVDKYYISLLSELRIGLGLMSSDQCAMGYIPIDLESIRKNIRFHHNKKRFDIYKALDGIFITEVQKGSNHTGQRTMVTTNIKLQRLIAIEEPIEEFKNLYGDYLEELKDPSKYDRVDIDLKSLDHYIRNTLEFIDVAESKGKTVTKLLQYVMKATQIKIIAEQVGFLPQIKNPSAFGRMYYKGPNLQNAAVVVREAALGKCMKVDVSNSVFQWRLNIAKDIDPTIKLPETADYMQFKEKHRERLSDHVFALNKKLDAKYKLSLIKQAITAIGFGAKTTDTSMWKGRALGKVFTPLGSKVVQEETLGRFLSDPFISRFIIEQEMISDLIYKNKAVQKLVRSVEVKPIVSSNRGVEKAKVLAYLYQHAESALMQPVYDMLGDKVVLKVHDGFYAKDLTPSEKLNFKQHFIEEGVNFDITKITPYALNVAYIANEKDDHKALISQQEQQAKGFQPNSAITTGGTPITKNSDSTAVTQALRCDGSGYDGSGYDGQQSYRQVDTRAEDMDRLIKDRKYIMDLEKEVDRIDSIAASQDDMIRLLHERGA